MQITETYRVPIRNRVARPMLRYGIRAIFRLLSPVEIVGVENIPSGNPYIVAMNHVSLFDPPFILSFWPQTLEAMGAADIWHKRGQDILVRMYGAIPVHRGQFDRRLFERVLSALKSGKPLLIAPEGGRSHVPAMRQAKPGIAFIFELARVPVIPVGIIGTTEDYWTQATRGKRPPLEMRIGKPIDLPGHAAMETDRREARQRNADLVMAHIAGLLPEEYRGYYANSAIETAAQTSH